ncbi:MAG: toll/interleukin-1 receptor domain-containing protein [Clostridia bacterium]|nr:toll/interleukin-1 receptor domain-containing protein [Clostridia bacterium]
MGGQVFISYSSKDRDTAKRIKEALEQAGFSCWMDKGSIPFGSSYAAEIENAIRSCDAFVLILSDAAMHSKWVEKELDRAENHNKMVLPYVTEPCELTDAFQYYLTNVQMFLAYENRKQALSQLIDSLKQQLRPVTPPMRHLPRNHLPLRRTKTIFVIISAVLLVVIVSVILFLMRNCTAGGEGDSHTTTTAAAAASTVKESTTQEAEQEMSVSRSVKDHIVVPSLADPLESFSLTPYNY